MLLLPPFHFFITIALLPPPTAALFRHWAPPAINLTLTVGPCQRDPLKGWEVVVVLGWQSFFPKASWQMKSEPISSIGIKWVPGAELNFDFFECPGGLA